MSDIGDRLKTVRGEESQEQFSSRFGIHRNTLAKWESGERSIDLSVLVSIMRHYGISSQWMILGTGDMYGGPEQMHRSEGGQGTTPLAQPTPCDVDMVYVPLVEARLSAGTGSFETGGESEKRYGFRSDFLCRKGQISQMVLMRVEGDSMEPEIKHGDVVLIDQSQTTPRAGGMFAVGVEDLVYIKMVDAKPGKIILKSVNPAYEPLEIDSRGDLADGIRIVGKAIWLGREMR
jgi:phage repressor protein C with HTH and peptisase S24 domain